MESTHGNAESVGDAGIVDSHGGDVAVAAPLLRGVQPGIDTAAPTPEAEEVQGMAAGVAAEEVSFESVNAIAHRLGILPERLMQAVRGKVLLVKICDDGLLLLRTVEIERILAM